MPAPTIVSFETYPDERLVRRNGVIWGAYNRCKFVGVDFPVVSVMPAFVNVALPTFDRDTLARSRAFLFLASVDIVGPPYASIVYQRLCRWSTPGTPVYEAIDRTSYLGATGRCRPEFVFEIEKPKELDSQWPPPFVTLTVRWHPTSSAGACTLDNPKIELVEFRTSGSRTAY